MITLEQSPTGEWIPTPASLATAARYQQERAERVERRRQCVEAARGRMGEARA